MFFYVKFFYFFIVYVIIMVIVVIDYWRCFMAYFLKKTTLKGRTYLSIVESFYSHPSLAVSTMFLL